MVVRARVRPIKNWSFIVWLSLLSWQLGAHASDRPLIGILSQPGGPAPEGFSYIAASYVKQIEASGARAVPIECTLPASEIKKRFNVVNGLVIPGGGQSLVPGEPYFDAARLLVNLTMAASEEGDYFPIHGVCLGLEVLSIILSQPFNTSILAQFDAENYPSTIQLTGEAASSRMFAGMDKTLQAAMQSQKVLMENHVNGLSYEGYLKNDGLKNLFTVTSFGQDRNGKVHVASMESVKYPITATQFHPEKNAFEWTTRLDIPHSAIAVELTHGFGNFIVSEARKSNHSAANASEENKLLISNYPLIFTAAERSKGVETDFDECYFFPMIAQQIWQ